MGSWISIFGMSPIAAEGAQRAPSASPNRDKEVVDAERARPSTCSPEGRVTTAVTVAGAAESIGGAATASTTAPYRLPRCSAAPWGSGISRGDSFAKSPVTEWQLTAPGGEVRLAFARIANQGCWRGGGKPTEGGMPCLPMVPFNTAHVRVHDPALSGLMGMAGMPAF